MDILYCRDGDGIPDDFDNCPLTPNPQQSDIDADGTGKNHFQCIHRHIQKQVNREPQS